MKKKLLIYMLVFLLLLVFAGTALTGCATLADSADSVGSAFVGKLVARDYSGAFDYVYVLTSDVNTRDEFAARFSNIYDALEISDVRLVSRSVEPVSENEYELKYTLALTSKILGVLTYDYSADIVAGPQGYTVLYTPSLILPMLEEGDKVRATSQEGARGEIFSADGAVLAKNDYADSVYIDLEKSPDIEAVKSFLAADFGADPETIQKKYDNAVEKAYPVEVLLSYPKGTVTDEQKEAIAGINGLGFDDSRFTPIRYYPLKDDAAHIIGYMGSPSEEQLAASEDLSEYSTVGKSGLEMQYEDTLRGSDGRIIYIEDEKGNVKQTLFEDEKTDGQNIELSIDSKTQERAYTLMASNLVDGQSGAALVMDYTTGAVEAMVSYPSFDNNLFNFPLDEGTWNYYNDDDDHPLINRATQSAYMPGSSFKPFSSLPAIEAGILDADSVPGITKKPPHSEGNDSDSYSWTPDVEGWHSRPIYSKTVAESPYNYEMAMKSSDNIFFAYYALQAGVDPFKSYLEKIGIGEAPQFELPVTASSMLSQSEDEVDWLDWLARTGYGTGELVITPLQLACMYTGIENGGTMMNPTIVRRTFTIEGEDETETTVSETAPSAFREGTMSQKAIDMIKPALKRVMVNGTGAPAGLGGSDVIGKTGTAQVGANNSREVNWIITLNQEDGKLYLVVVETDTDEGSKPKIAILRGMVDENAYSQMLTGLSGGSDDTSSSDDTSGGEE
ncbi:penicillin-binding transpeptidase domain-containing protein [Christensenella intestinihominis]|uniref:penicillin-binding transpeptidase domain-containing protein n=1 Tax=Christensenella intestinihominis TaxID=1851429 RepID=UPI000834637F|nr:penicillin-binding transpeptidase domain-containing protein [Christensenella intestinihominis]